MQFLKLFIFCVDRENALYVYSKLITSSNVENRKSEVIMAYVISSSSSERCQKNFYRRAKLKIVPCMSYNFICDVMKKSAVAVSYTMETITEELRIKCVSNISPYYIRILYFHSLHIFVL